MKLRSALYILIFTCFTLAASSQTIYGVTPPDSIKAKCDKVIISEIGKTAFEKNIRYIKCDSHKGVYNNGETWQTYTVFYSFRFPDIFQSHVVFSLIYKKDARQSEVLKDVAFKNYTRLPASIKKGVKVVSYDEAKKVAMKAEPVLAKNEARLYGELSTEYDEKKKDYVFVWYFYYMEPCKNCEAETYTAYSVLIDAGSGKVLRTGKG